MKEIKFRGLSDNEDGTTEWVYGDLRNDREGETRYYGTHPYRICWSEGKADHNKPVRKGTIGQFTGYYDKKEVEIYEGMILKATAYARHKDSSCVSVVVCNESGEWQAAETREDGTVATHGLPLNWGGWKSLEIIGNIENKELLK